MEESQIAEQRMTQFNTQDVLLPYGMAIGARAFVAAGACLGLVVERLIYWRYRDARDRMEKLLKALSGNLTNVHEAMDPIVEWIALNVPECFLIVADQMDRRWVAVGFVTQIRSGKVT